MSFIPMEGASRDPGMKEKGLNEGGFFAGWLSECAL